jgi:predicted Fe-S protein YdhL (DUF1289 family)
VTQPLSLSPCVKVCRLDADTNMCIGCGRLLSEIAAWSRLSPEQQHAVCEAAAQRLRARAQVERPP